MRSVKFLVAWGPWEVGETAAEGRTGLEEDVDEEDSGEVGVYGSSASRAASPGSGVTPAPAWSPAGLSMADVLRPLVLSHAELSVSTARRHTAHTAPGRAAGSHENNNKKLLGGNLALAFLSPGLSPNWLPSSNASLSEETSRLPALFQFPGRYDFSPSTGTENYSHKHWLARLLQNY
ncbi:hypothetical protein DPEC_G00221580 [Dallia pectoralis]|uniref:Uncharacterized protein n=1 Tax=Dallia pectoralis TaxID=75939 RepID=A0ACC2G423_DALPE|nr:hypothetical protein DPEC_G00221580 [Dallia pectoralis]